MEKIRHAASILAHMCPTQGQSRRPHVSGMHAGEIVRTCSTPHALDQPILPSMPEYVQVRNAGTRVRTDFVLMPTFSYKGRGTLRATLCVASINPSPRLMKALLFDVQFRDVELGEHYDSQEAAQALKAMALTAESALAALRNKSGLQEHHYDLLASLHRCRTVAGALDHHHGFSKRSKNSSRRLLLERTLTALQALQIRYEATQQLLVDAYDTLPDHDLQASDLQTLLEPDTVVPLMQTCAGQTKLAQQRLALQETYVLSLIRRGRAEYEEVSHRL